MRTTMILAAALLATACDTPDSRQNDQAMTDDTMAGDGMTGDGQPGAMANGDAMATENVPTDTYITRAAISDMYEIEAGKLAVKNGQSEDTRKFGQMMIDDHTQSSNDMKAALAKVMPAVAAPTQLDAEHQQMLDRLKSARGEAFDREYQSQQMMAHRKAMALHEGYAANGENAELKLFAQKVTPVIRKHHDRISEMAGTAATQTGTTSQPANGANPAGQ